MHQTPWSPERPLPPPVSLTSSHHENPPEVTCTSRGKPGFPASTRERPRKTCGAPAGPGSPRRSREGGAYLPGGGAPGGRGFQARPRPGWSELGARPGIWVGTRGPGRTRPIPPHLPAWTLEKLGRRAEARWRLSRARSSAPSPLTLGLAHAPQTEDPHPGLGCPSWAPGLPFLG